ncbi:uncharacterized protein LOC121879048 isoform X2 [Homarus americanus]|uniref:uncharacterized protein LOC121879048 isoform X2 n=1 Tax=Homarus americanus TaxID=6706 RepID=UPI001C48CBF0|nr:uncharacterized protein LOC121879048 isoform X2 [Homarus americanus]
MLTTILMLATAAAALDTQNLTALFHEALANDGSLQSSVGVSGQLADLELVYLRRHPGTPPHPTKPQPSLFFNIPTKRQPPAPPLFYSFTAFRRRYRLRLRPMTHLVSPSAHLRVVGGPQLIPPTPFTPMLCHYTHVDDDITAALSACKPRTLAGYVVSRNTTLELRPLEGAAADALHHAISKRGGSKYTSQSVPHLVRRVPRSSPSRPEPSMMELEIPPPACKESIGNAIPSEMEFDQGEIFTVPPEAWHKTTLTETTTTTRPSPRPGGQLLGGGLEEQPLKGVPEGRLLPPHEVLKRSIEVEMFGQVNSQTLDGDRELQQKREMDQEARPIVFPPTHPGSVAAWDVVRRSEGSSREPKPMRGVDRQPKPIIFATTTTSPSDKIADAAGDVVRRSEGSSRKPKPMRGVDRQPKPMIIAPTPTPTSPPSDDVAMDAAGDVVRRSEGSSREPKPMRGVDRQPKPMIFATTTTTIPPSATTATQDSDASQHDQHEVKKRSQSKTIELGVFVDQAAYDLFFPYLGSSVALTEFILGYINGIQALFHHPTLGQKIQLVINYIELMAKQPTNLVHFGGDREKLYDSFRLYNAEKTKSSENMVDVQPWDIGILISGHNFYSTKGKNGKPSYSSMGLAAVRGVCHPDYSAVIVELGVTDTWGKPYTTAGFASVYVMAHEIGHNVGMLHDGFGNSCPKNGYIMSASRSTSGETNWSSCSREILETIKAPCLSEVMVEPTRHDHHKYKQLPGQTWDAYDQCRIFLRDKEATLYNQTLDQNVCKTVMCRSPNRIGYFKAGPALDGTFCGNSSWCIAGECAPWSLAEAPPVVKGGWGPWHHTPCTSGCLIDALGIQVSKRNCSDPKPMNTADPCLGISTRLKTCDDDKVCNGNKISVKEYANNKCKEFSTVVTDLQHRGAQAPHNPTRQWQACAIFCQRASGTWYSPRTDLSYLPHFDTYFPDGTPCHVEAGKQFYCQRHQCLPLGEREAKAMENPDPEWDVHVYQNAPPQPSNNTVPEQVARIFELNKNMDPLQSEPLDLYHVEDETLWEDDDYLHV